MSTISIDGLRCAPELRLQELGTIVDLSTLVPDESRPTPAVVPRVIGALHIPEEDGGLRRTAVPGSAVAVAICDAIDVVAASLSTSRLDSVLRRLGFCAGPAEIVEEGGFPVQAQLETPACVRAWVDSLSTRRVTVSVSLTLDPLLYGTLREHAMRDPRLVTALSGDPSLELRVGWLFTRDHSALSIALLDVRVGEVSFPTGERPTWLPGLLTLLAERFHRVDGREPIEDVVSRVFRAGLSPEVERREGYGRVCQALANPPFALGDPELIEGPEVGFGNALLRLRQLGPRAAASLRAVEAVHLHRPDVLVLEAPREATRAWLTALLEEKQPPIEQVFVS